MRGFEANLPVGFFTYPISPVSYTHLDVYKRQALYSSIPRDCIIVLGAGVYGNGKPTKILQDRLDRGIELYKAGAAPKLLLSGDNGKANYDEVKVMRLSLIHI